MKRLAPSFAQAFDRSLPPALTVRHGDEVAVETADARGGVFDGIPPGTAFELPPRTEGTGNPLTGPIALEAARPGEALLVTVRGIRTADHGWIGAHRDRHPLTPGRLPASLARICAIRGGVVDIGASIAVPVRATIGCIGTAPAGKAVFSGFTGRHGGNLDHPLIGVGAAILLPVQVAGGLLSVGDVHAAQGDGELSGIAVEVAATVTLRIDLVRNFAPAWPWVQTRDRIAVLTSAEDLDTARREAADAMATHIEHRLGIGSAHALALMSAAADLRFGQARGGPLTLRLEMPLLPNLALPGLEDYA